MSTGEASVELGPWAELAGDLESWAHRLEEIDAQTLTDLESHAERLEAETDSARSIELAEVGQALERRRQAAAAASRDLRRLSALALVVRTFDPSEGEGLEAWEVSGALAQASALLAGPSVRITLPADLMVDVDRLAEVADCQPSEVVETALRRMTARPEPGAHPSEILAEVADMAASWGEICSSLAESLDEGSQASTLFEAFGQELTGLSSVALNESLRLVSPLGAQIPRESLPIPVQRLPALYRAVHRRLKVLGRLVRQAETTAEPSALRAALETAAEQAERATQAAADSLAEVEA